MKTNPEITEMMKEDVFLTFISVVESEAMQTAIKHTTKNLDANYEKADLEKLVIEECKLLHKGEKELLLKLLREYETLFDGALRNFKTLSVSLEVKNGEQSSHSKAFTIPKIHKETLKKEIQ